MSCLVLSWTVSWRWRQCKFAQQISTSDPEYYLTFLEAWNLMTFAFIRILLGSFNDTLHQQFSICSLQMSYTAKESPFWNNQFTFRGALARSMGKKFWLSMHPRNFGSEKIVRTNLVPGFSLYLRERTLVSAGHVERCLNKLHSGGRFST